MLADTNIFNRLTQYYISNFTLAMFFSNGLTTFATILLSYSSNNDTCSRGVEIASMVFQVIGLIIGLITVGIWCKKLLSKYLRKLTPMKRKEYYVVDESIRESIRSAKRTNEYPSEIAAAGGVFQVIGALGGLIALIFIMTTDNGCNILFYKILSDIFSFLISFISAFLALFFEKIWPLLLQFQIIKVDGDTNIYKILPNSTDLCIRCIGKDLFKIFHVTEEECNKSVWSAHHTMQVGSIQPKSRIIYYIDRPYCYK